MDDKITITFNFPTDPKYWEDGFLQDINRSSAWILSARDLLEHIRSMGDALRTAWIEYQGNKVSHESAPPRGQHRVYLFLSSLTIENLLKAIIVDHSKWPDSQIAQKIPPELNS